jgi:hypothetical protein
LSGSKDLVVHSHPWTSDQLITYLEIVIGAAVTVIGVILKVLSYFTARKQSKNLSKYVSKINKKYNEFNEEKSIDKNQFVKALEDIRSNITYLLERRGINENQYKMIDDKIANYLDKIAKPFKNLCRESAYKILHTHTSRHLSFIRLNRRWPSYNVCSKEMAERILNVYFETEQDMNDSMYQSWKRFEKAKKILNGTDKE